MQELSGPDLQEPLRCYSLLQRFPGLGPATDEAQVAAELSRLLFEPSGSRVTGSESLRAEIGEESCWLEYPLTVRTPAGGIEAARVIAYLFADARRAADYERTVLAPQLPPGGAATGMTLRSAVVERLSMAAGVFPVNGSLPTLVRLTDGEQASRALSSMLGQAVTVQRIDLVTLRRTRGCVLRFALDWTEHRVLYGKVGSTSDGDAAAAAAAVYAGAAERSPWLGLPRSLGHSQPLQLTLVTEVAGTPAALGSGEDRGRLVDRAGEVAAAIHGLPVTTGREATLEGEIDRAERAVALVGRDAPEPAARWQEALGRVREAAAGVPRQSPRPAHGSFAPSQLMFDGDRVAVLDLDRVCQAEPAHDLGRFLAPLRVTLGKHAAHGAADAAADRFLRSYRDHGGQPTQAARVALYECTALVRMAARSWLQLKPSRARIVNGILAEREVALERAA